jgi:hypothetical protein
LLRNSATSLLICIAMKHMPPTKNVSLYIHRKSNHPQSSTKYQHPPTSAFTIWIIASIYRESLKNSNYKDPFMYQATTKPEQNQCLKLISSHFYQVLKHDLVQPPKARQWKLMLAEPSQISLSNTSLLPTLFIKIFNQNNVKVCYSCVGNIEFTLIHSQPQIVKCSSTPDRCNCQTVKKCPTWRWVFGKKHCSLTTDK